MDVAEKGLKLLKKMGWYVVRSVFGAVNRVVSNVRRKAEDIKKGDVEGCREYVVSRRAV